MGYLKKRFMNIKIRSKMIYSYVLIAIIPFCLVGGVGVSVTTGEMEKNVTQYSTQMVGQILRTVDLYINSIEKKVNMLIRMIEPMHIEEATDCDSGSWKEQQRILVADFQAVARTHGEIAGIFLDRKSVV